MVILGISFEGSFAEFVYLWLACVASSVTWIGRSRLGLYDLKWSIVRSFSGAVLLSKSWFVFQS